MSFWELHRNRRGLEDARLVLFGSIEKADEIYSS